MWVSDTFVSDSVWSIAGKKGAILFLSKKKAGLGNRLLSWKNENEKV